MEVLKSNATEHILYKNYSTTKYTSLEVIFNRRVVLILFMKIIARMSGRSKILSLAEPFNLVSSVWHFEMMM